MGESMNAIQKSRVDRITELHDEIAGSLRRTLKRAIEIGGLLTEQRLEMKHGEFIPWVEKNLPFDVRTAQRYMRVYRKKPELKYDSVSYLTEAYSKLASRQEAFERRERSNTLSEGNLPLEVTGKYRVIYADPPWQYGSERLGNSGDAKMHYPTMLPAAIGELPVEDLAEDNAVLFLWTTSPMLRKAMDVVESWGFTYKASFVWDKIKHNFGYYNSVRHEMLLICTRGSCTPDVAKLHDSVVSIERTKHSEKPEYFRGVIDEIYPNGRRIELFARGMLPGNWDVWGNEAAVVPATVNITEELL